MFRLLVTSPDLIMVNGLPEMVTHAKGLFKAFKSEKYKILIGYDTQFNITNGYVRQYNYYLNHHYRRHRHYHCHRHHCRHHHHHIGYFQVSWLCITDPRYTHAVSGASMILPLFQVLTFFWIDFPRFLSPTVGFQFCHMNLWKCDYFNSCDCLSRWYTSESWCITMTMPGWLWRTLWKSWRRLWECPVCMIIGYCRSLELLNHPTVSMFSQTTSFQSCLPGGWKTLKWSSVKSMVN